MTMSPFRLRLLSAAPLLLAAAAPLPASAQGVYLCMDANGRKELTDNFKPGCKTLAIQNGVPAPAARAPSSAPRAPVTSPADFPKVDNAIQKARDNDRREILNEELRAEERKLAELKREYNNGLPERMGNERNYVKYQERVAQMAEAITRAEKNLEALRREIGNIK
jgi:hypothetical protein